MPELHVVRDARRWFDVEFGIHYTICARDESHVMEVLEKADNDYAETMRELGGGVITEIDPQAVARRTFWEDGGELPLNTMALGDWASSEF